MLPAMTSTQPENIEISQTQKRFKTQLTEITAQIQKRTLDGELEDWLNGHMGIESLIYGELKKSCELGVAQGWLCNREGGGIRYGRIFKPAEELHNFSVDVVLMENIAGPHHTHPNGEIDLIMPLDASAHFDDKPGGWMVCPAGSSHSPTVSRGKALILYLLPQGAIEFTK